MITEKTRTLRGSCYCGAVRYTVPDHFAYVLNCHCSNCRRQTGGAFKPFAGLPREQLRIERVAEHLMRYGDPNGHDARCRTCGSLLYSLVRDGKFVHIALGSLLDAPTQTPSAHIFVGSKAPWYAILDDLLQHAEFP